MLREEKKSWNRMSVLRHPNADMAWAARWRERRGDDGSNSHISSSQVARMQKEKKKCRLTSRVRAYWRMVTSMLESAAACRAARGAATAEAAKPRARAAEAAIIVEEVRGSRGSGGRVGRKCESGRCGWLEEGRVVRFVSFEAKTTGDPPGPSSLRRAAAPSRNKRSTADDGAGRRHSRDRKHRRDPRSRLDPRTPAGPALPSPPWSTLQAAQPASGSHTSSAKKHRPNAAMTVRQQARPITSRQPLRLNLDREERPHLAGGLPLWSTPPPRSGVCHRVG